jgi:hypothetical protein
MNLLPPSSFFYPEDGSSRIFRNMVLLCQTMASHTKVQ